MGPLLSPHIPTNIFDINYNLLTGDFPFEAIPESLWKLRISGNQFSGAIVLYKPAELFFYGNLITNVTIIDSSILTNCDLGGNPLLDFDLSALSMCSIANIYAIGSTLIEPSNYTEMTFADDLFPTEYMDYNHESTIVQYKSTAIVRIPLTRQVRLNASTMKSTHLTSIAHSLTTFHKMTTQSELSSSYSISYLNVYSFNRPLITIEHFYWFSVLKLAVDMICLVYLIVKLVKRRYGKRPSISYGNSQISKYSK